MKFFMPADALVQMGLAWVAGAPLALVRFIGIAELSGAIGIILPALTRIVPGLTPLAAIGLAAIQVLAIPFHMSRGEFGVLPMNAVLLALALFVFWGRSKKLRVGPRRFGRQL